MVEHIVLLGDSIFDNGCFVGSEPSVIEQLQALLPPGWHATLCAVDGATTRDIRRQVQTVPSDATHLFLSVGGNDALGYMDLLRNAVLRGQGLPPELGQAIEQFRSSYRAAILEVLRLKKPTCVCTIYNGNFDGAVVEPAKEAVAMFDDVICSVAGEHSLPVIDLRTICTQPRDYANPIEPSGSGGKKIAEAVCSHVMRT
jgi:hypothetical protein